MEYGLFINGSRPKTKKQVKEAISTGISRVSLENTSMFGNPSSGFVTDVPDGTYTFVGPDPYRERRWYGNIIKRGVKITVS